MTTKKTYRCSVTATNAQGASVPSAKSNAVIVGAPGRPHAPSVTRLGPGHLKVSFAAPASNGAPITSFKAVCRSSNGGVPRGKSGGASPLGVRGLTIGKTYTCTVEATNSRGTGPTSESSGGVDARHVIGATPVCSPGARTAADERGDMRRRDRRVPFGCVAHAGRAGDPPRPCGRHPRAGSLQRWRRSRASGLPAVGRRLVHRRSSADRSSGAPATSPYPATTTATAPPTSPCSDRPTAPGTSRDNRPCSSGPPATSPYPATTTATAPPTSRCTDRPTAPGTSTSAESFSHRCRSANPVTCPCPAITTVTAPRISASSAAGTWLIRNQPTIAFGIDHDVPVPADYNGDGTTDPAVYRPSAGGWYLDVNGVAGPPVYFGLATDVPVPGNYQQ